MMQKIPQILKKNSPDSRMVLVVDAIIYFIVYSQMFSIIVLFAKHNVDLYLIGFSVSPATYAALDSF
ncbi:hypothetical protein A2G94_02275 [Francisella endosymbiont of Ornithodoros moubata]|uniref:POT-type proton-dependent oligopeptide transporter n=1 Tax=Francisella-like endosymbiont TaxID=512373 RepID=UPI000A21A356|nr:hypothetical protein A2G94_02275 [Francisella endosymbiont of Ornithodoros moubata]